MGRGAATRWRIQPYVLRIKMVGCLCKHQKGLPMQSFSFRLFVQDNALRLQRPAKPVYIQISKADSLLRTQRSRSARSLPLGHTGYRVAS